jgi:acetyl-CoA hydrolase
MPIVQPSSEFDFSTIIEAGHHVAWPQGTGEPTGLTARLMAQALDLAPATLVLGMVSTNTLHAQAANAFRYLCLNGAANTRRAVAFPGSRVIPAHVSQIPHLITSGRLPVDIALVRVRPTDDPETFSLGVMVDYVHELIGKARIVIGELDERMPLTRGDTLVPRASIDRLVIADSDEPSIPDPVPSAVDLQVARNVAAVIPNRATIQLGVGALPTAVCASLAGHSGLGLHSGVIPDAAVSLIESGAVDNCHKGIDSGISVTGGLFGTRRLFALADRNDAMALRRATYTHSAQVLASLKNLYSINSAVEIDLTGQANAEIAGGRYVGAVGGQVDYVRGSRLSAGGRSILAMASTTPAGDVSKIVANLAARPVTTARSDVDMVITEHGVADLWGLDLHARAKAMIAIAAPAFRETLEREISDRP